MSRVKELRIKQKYSQQQLADILSVTQSAVAKWETGESKPRADMLPKLAKILNCTIDDLLSADERTE